MAEKIQIKDNNLAQLFVKELIALGVRKEGTSLDKIMFTKEELSQITKLNIDGHQIESIEGLENCTNLTALYIESPGLEAILENLSEEEKDSYLSQRKSIFDPSIIEKLESLEILTIKHESSLTSLDLTRLQNLRVLALENNINLLEIKGIEELKKLEELSLHQTPVESPLKIDQLLDQNTLTELSLDVDMYPQLVQENPEIAEKLLEKQENEGLSVNFKENLTNLRTQELSLEKLRTMDEKVQLILEDIIDFDYTTAEKIAAIYTYITKNITQNREADALQREIQLPTTGIESKVLDEKFERLLDEKRSTYSTIMREEGISEGYANLMHYMLRSIGVRSKVIESQTNKDMNNLDSKSNHAVIRVMIDNNWYYFDPTLDKERREFKNFFKTKEEFRENHELSEQEFEIQTPIVKAYTNLELTQITNKVYGDIERKENQLEENSMSAHLKDGNIAAYEEKTLGTASASAKVVSDSVKEQSNSDGATKESDSSRGYEVKDQERTPEEKTLKSDMEEIKDKLIDSYTRGKITKEDLDRALGNLKRTLEDRKKEEVKKEIEKKVEENKEQEQKQGDEQEDEQEEKQKEEQEDEGRGRGLWD